MSRCVILREIISESRGSIYYLYVRTSISDAYAEEKVAASIRMRTGRFEVHLPTQTGFYKPAEFSSLDEAVDHALKCVE